jgi:hypothetical protein
MLIRVERDLERAGVGGKGRFSAVVSALEVAAENLPFRHATPSKS